MRTVAKYVLFEAYMTFCTTCLHLKSTSLQNFTHLGYGDSLAGVVMLEPECRFSAASILFILYKNYPCGRCTYIYLRSTTTHYFRFL